MTTIVFRRPARQPGPELPTGEVSLQEPPTLPEAGGVDASSVFTMLPMVAMSAMMMLFFVTSASPQMRYLIIGATVLTMGGSMIAQLSRGSSGRKRKLGGERRDYLRYLGQMRRTARRIAEAQTRAVQWNHPAPDQLWTLAATRRMWERRPSHPDFVETRIGTGMQPLSVRLVPPHLRPVEDLEPLCLLALRRYLVTHQSVPGLPLSVRLSDFARVLVRPGDAEDADDVVRALARAVVAQLVTFHAPDDVHVVVCATLERQAEWDWVKWLPHAQHPSVTDGAGGRRLVVDSLAEAEQLLGSAFVSRPRFIDNDPSTVAEEPYVLLILDGAPVAETARIAGEGIRNCTVLDVSESLRWRRDTATLRLVARADSIELITTGRSQGDQAQPLGRPDQLTVAAARTLARGLSPYRVTDTRESGTATSQNFDLVSLMGLRDPAGFELDQARSQAVDRQFLRIPIGVSEGGSPIELDLKEAAQGGMGPHGLLIGATGSGKSELLRTLIIALAVRHSSELLNFVLVDFKGGASFIGFERLPHTSATITNLSDDLPQVDRMQEALQGEMIRRQELLRRAGYASLRDYAKARAAGAPLDPLPTLMVVVDEFSELLSSKREFIDLFVMIGRLGRSLGVHLLLASQRIDEGRMNALESHLSYRIGLRTFSAMESRSVIGVPYAYELPSEPGNGYLRPDTTSLIRFKAAYVSAPYHRETPALRQREVQRRLVPYSVDVVPNVTPDPVADLEPTVAEPASAAAVQDATASTLLDVLIDRLADEGPQAHRVWLPPLADAPPLDSLLPPLAVDPERGLAAPEWSGQGTLTAPVGVIDRPADQRRDPLIADLTGSGGHVGVVGGPQSGKSTLLRTLLTALALTHTPREVQFYCLDFGGGTLAPLSQLPHVGTVTTRMDPERVGRTVAEIKNLLVRREQAFAANGVASIAAFREMLRQGTLPAEADDGYGDVFLVVDGWGVLRKEFEQLEASFTELATNGLNYGIHLVVSAPRWSDIRPWLRDLLGTRFELHLGDPVESEVGMRMAANVPAIPGRGITRSAEHFLAALPRLDGVEGTEGFPPAATEALRRIRDAWSGPPARAVRLLPTALDHTELPEPDGDLRVAIGVDEECLEPVWFDFAQTPNLLMFGDSETGKTSALRLISEAITRRYRPDEAQLIIVDSRRDLYGAVAPEYQLGYAVSGMALSELIATAMEPLLERIPGPDITPEQLPLQDWWSGPKLFVVVDDLDLIHTGVAAPLLPLLELATHGAAIGLYLIVARSTVGAARAAMMDPVIRQLWELGAPALMFSCAPEEGAFLGGAKPLRLIPGRAQLVTRRRPPRLVQTGFCPPASAATPAAVGTPPV